MSNKSGLLGDIAFGVTRAIATAAVRHMERLANVIGAQNAATVVVSGCLAAAVGVYKSYSVAADQPYDPDYLRKTLDRALEARFVVAERKSDGSFADPKAMQ